MLQTLSHQAMAGVPKLLPRDVPASGQRSFTGPQHMQEPVQYRGHPSAYTAPVGSAWYDPPKRSKSDIPMDALRDKFPYNARSQSSTSFYHPQSQGQPNSFPQTNQRGVRDTGRGYSSLNGAANVASGQYSSSEGVSNLDGGGQQQPQQQQSPRLQHPPQTQQPNYYPPQPQGQPQSFPQTSPRGGNKPPHSSLEEGNMPRSAQMPSHMQHQSQRPYYADRSPPSPSRAGALHDTLHSNRPTVSAQGRTYSDTALTVGTHPAPHQPYKSNSQLDFSQNAPPRAPVRNPTPLGTSEVSGTSAAPSSSGSSVQQHSSIPYYVSKSSCSQASLENERYSLERGGSSDHPNEDRYFATKGPGYKIFAVFDGHEGPRAAGFASNYMMQLFDTPSWSHIVRQDNPAIICEALHEFFRTTENDYFKSIQPFIDEKERLQKKIPSGLSSYAAYQQYPREVSKIQQLEPKLTGGCTAVLALIVNNRLYVANAGDSRVLLAREGANGTLSIEQLSVDHSVENEDELKRLEGLGLDPKLLLKSGRLGMHENTRSIGDYSIKQGYKDVDTLRCARSAPGIVTPYVMPAREIDHTFQYLILMTDGIYKSLESTFAEKYSIDSNKVVLATIERAVNSSNKFDYVADTVVDRIATIHKDCYEKNARMDARSPLAVSCRKRDDMTLLIHRFQNAKSLN